jgi:GxxExxY protein
MDEKLCERALISGLRRTGHTVASQKIFPVFYHAQLIGNLTPDVVVDDAIIVDPKVVSGFNETHMEQMIGYLGAGSTVEFQERPSRMEADRTAGQ